MKRVVYQGKFSAVVARAAPDGIVDFDVWQWNLLKRKWVRLANTACGFADLTEAKPVCDEIDAEAVAAVDAARNGVPALR
jgi:hypothetical protein